MNARLKKELKPYLIRCKAIRERHLDKASERYLLAVAKIYFKPEKIEAVIRRNEMIFDSMNTDDKDKITDLMIEQAKDWPIVALYEFQNIKSGPARFVACCPFHSEKTGSFTVYPNNTYYCFGCHEGGDVIAFVRKLHGFNFVDSVKFLLNQ